MSVFRNSFDNRLFADLSGLRLRCDLTQHRLIFLLQFLDFLVNLNADRKSEDHCRDDQSREHLAMIGHAFDLTRNPVVIDQSRAGNSQ